MKHILFVDDEPNFLAGLRRLLRDQQDWTLHFAGGVDEALNEIENHIIDAVVSDVNMPGKTGFDLLRLFAEHPRGKMIPIIILTGNAETDLKRNALDLGATDLLNKPVTREDLVARLRSVLRIKAYQDEIRAYSEHLEEKIRERTREVEQSRLEIIWRLAKAGEYRDEETGNHVLRVALNSRILAESLGMPRQFLEMLFLTSPLHDIGKIGVPDAILLKTDRLTAAETAVMRQHCAIGAGIFRAEPLGMTEFKKIFGLPQDDAIRGDSNPMIEMAACIAMSHHERWAGGGYPAGLAGDAIPVEGRIVAVADVYDALRSERPYKRPFTEEETFAMIRSEAGGHFDPAVVNAFEKSREAFDMVEHTYASPRHE